jgi:hypothetical protein
MKNVVTTKTNNDLNKGAVAVPYSNELRAFAPILPERFGSISVPAGFPIVPEELNSMTQPRPMAVAAGNRENDGSLVD